MPTGREPVRFSGATHSIDSLTSGRMRVCLDHWRAGRPVGDLVLRSSLALDTLRPALGRIGLTDVYENPRRYRYRLYGVELAASTGEYTGRWAHEIQPPAYRAVILHQYDETVAARQPLLHVVVATCEGRSASYRRLTIPLSTGQPEVAQLWMTTVGLRAFASVVWGRNEPF